LFANYKTELRALVRACAQGTDKAAAGSMRLPRLKRETPVKLHGQRKTRRFINRWRFCSSVGVKYSGVGGGLMKLNYVIKFVDDMDRAVKFHRDVLGLPLKFDSPEWSEFSTGDTTLALHKASAKNAAGTVELGFTVPDLHKFYADMSAKGVQFTMPPTKQDFGSELAQFVDSEGGRNSVGKQ
jgi:lactoylglutathione lyase